MRAGMIPVQRELSGGSAYSGAADASYQASLIDGWEWALGGAGVYALYQEMEDKDAHLFSTLQTRKNALLGCAWKVVASGDSAEAQKAAQVVESVLSKIPNFHGALYHLLDGLAKGFAVAEILWHVHPEPVLSASVEFPAGFREISHSMSPDGLGCWITWERRGTGVE